MRALWIAALAAHAWSCSGDPATTSTPAEPVLRSLGVVVAGARVHYLQAGPADGREVLLLHGARYRADTWAELGTLALLARRGCRALAVDLPGFGASEPVTALASEDYLAALVDALALARPIVVSPSMSGRFSLPFLARQPERVAGFVALAPVDIERWASQLDAVDVPTLCIWGSDDASVPREHADLLVQRIRGAELAVLPDTGHACYLEAPERFHELLVAFLARAR